MHSFKAALFSPASLFTIGFILPFSLVFIGFSKEVPTPSAETIITIFIGIISFVSGILSINFLLPRFIKEQKNKNTGIKRPIFIAHEKLLFLSLVVIWLVCISMLWLEFAHLGALPLLSPDVETLRFQLQINGATHLLAIASGFIAFLFFVLFSYTNNNTYKKISLSIIVITILSLSLTANRVDFMYPGLLMLFFSMLNSGKIFTKKHVVIILAFVMIFVSINIYRSSQHNKNFQAEIASGIGEKYQTVQPAQNTQATQTAQPEQNMPTRIKNKIYVTIYPLYMTLTYSFEMLNKVVNNDLGGTTGGLYTFYAFHSLKPGHQESFGEFKNRALGINFYAELTSTYLSNFYVDFGNIGVLIASLIYGAILQALWLMLRNNKKYIIIYTVNAATLIFCFYAFYYVYFYAFFQIILAIYTTIFIKTEKNNEDKTYIQR